MSKDPSVVDIDPRFFAVVCRMTSIGLACDMSKFHPLLGACHCDLLVGRTMKPRGTSGAPDRLARPIVSAMVHREVKWSVGL